MDFKEYQKEASTTAIYLDKVKQEFPEITSGLTNILGLAYTTLGLNGELGEVAEKIKKIIRDSGGIISDEKRNELSKEIGDVIWYISALCTELRLDLNDVAQQNIDKLKSRKERGQLQGNGDNR